MELQNQTFVEEIILFGFPQGRKLCILLFVTLFLMYIFIILGNIFLIAAVLISPKLHLPMYFFLCNLSIIDLSFSSSTIPKVLIDILSVRRAIPIMACMVQMHTGTFLGSTESLLLAVMAYDRYVAISFPLYYNIIMNWKVCRILILIMWPIDFCITVVPVITRPMVFCKDNQVDHFVCEILAVVELACGNLKFFKVALLVGSLLTLVVPLVFIVVSYIFIISSILKIRSRDGRSKAFSTCASHLIVVSMFYGTSISMYVGQKKGSASHIKYFSMFYGIVTPAVNPLIYSLRNNDVKEAFQKMIARVIH